jgi:hypothetical protein
VGVASDSLTLDPDGKLRFHNYSFRYDGTILPNFRNAPSFLHHHSSPEFKHVNPVLVASSLSQPDASIFTKLVPHYIGRIRIHNHRKSWTLVGVGANDFGCTSCLCDFPPTCGGFALGREFVFGCLYLPYFYVLASVLSLISRYQ